MRGKIEKNWLLAVILALFFVLNTQIPKVIDDYPYSRSFVGVSSPAEDTDVNHRVANIGDLIDSQVNHYYAINGRTPIQTLVQCFCCWWGKGAYNIFATFLLLVIAIGISRLAGKDAYLETFVCVCLLTFLSGPSTLYNGITVGLNYLMPTALCVWFLLILKDYTIGTWRSWGLLLLAFFAGWSHECLSLPLAGVLLCCLLRYRKRMSVKQVVAVMLFLMGCLLLVLAPANLIRVSDSATDTDYDGLQFRLMQFRHLRITYLYIICLVISVVRGMNIRAYARKESLWLSALLLALAMSFCIGAVNERVVYGAEVFALILMCRLIYIASKSMCWRRYIRYIAGVVCVVVLIAVNILQSSYSEQFKKVDKAIANSNEKECIVRLDKVVCFHPRIEKYTSAHLDRFQLYQFQWWYGKDTVIILSQPPCKQHHHQHSQ
ncbi:MAG: DUF6056 family protein [Prevotella sp.]|nr:DUF6056 family protein [Prevotella sp.]